VEFTKLEYIPILIDIIGLFIMQTLELGHWVQDTQQRKRNENTSHKTKKVSNTGPSKTKTKTKNKNNKKKKKQ
jgi:hypothetical protein